MTSIETKKQKDKMMTAIFTGGAAFAVILLIAFVLYVVVSGISGMTPQLLSFSPTGLGNMFFNTIYLVVLALVASTRPLIGKGYLYPLIPFNGRDLRSLLHRRPISRDNT